jgi:hypothetical protein
MNSEISFDYRITDAVSPRAAAGWKALAVTITCAVFASLLLWSARNVYSIFPDPALLMDPPVVNIPNEQQYASTAPVEQLGN